MSQRFNDSLYESLLITQEDFKTIEEINANGNSKFIGDLPRLTLVDSIHSGIEEFYRKSNDGWGIKWEQEKYSSIGGNIQLAETRHLFADPKDNGIYYDETEEGSDLRYFHPFDFPTPESYVGFVIKPDTIYKSVYYMSISDNSLRNLDLDFQGYTQMALEARVFYYWQLVLLYYMNGKGIGEQETETFKTEMPKIFPDWTWENFIEKFESLRLSKEQ